MRTTVPGEPGSENSEDAPRVHTGVALRLLLSSGGPHANAPSLHPLVRHVAEAFGVRSAALVQPLPGGERVSLLAFWSRNSPHEGASVLRRGTALDEVLQHHVLHCPEDAQARFPEDGWLRRLGARGVLGVSVRGPREEVLGALVLMHDEALTATATDVDWLRAFALLAGTTLERLHSQAILDESRDFLLKTLHAIEDPVFVKDREHRFIVTNEAMHRLLGRTGEELLGKSDYDFVPAHEADVFWRQDELAFTTGQSNQNEETLTDGAHVTRTLLTRKAVFHSSLGRPFLVGVIRDISEHKRLEAQLRLSDRLATMGTMAASVTHEINNPLSYINASLTFLSKQLASGPTALEAPSLAELRDAVADALDGTGRVRTLVQDLRTFARADDEHLEAVALHQVIGSAVRMVRHRMQAHVHLVLELEPVPAVRGNPARLGQVLVNLLVNALQSFSDDQPPPHRIRVSSRMSDTGHVVVEVEDNGRGMTPEVLARLFTPLFTTKPAGEGTGLGLTISQSIIHHMGGRIEVASTPAQGSTFRLVLPRLSPP